MQRISDVGRPERQDCTVEVDGERVVCSTGETVLGVLFAVGRVAISRRKQGIESSAYCGMGVCYCCCVTIDGVGSQRACQIPVRNGMRIETLRDLGDLTPIESDGESL